MSICKREVFTVLSINTAQGLVRKHLQKLQNPDAQHGFTLIELMVVILVIGILLGIAIPTYLSTVDSAHDASTQTDLANALLAARNIYLYNQGEANGQGYGTSAQAVSQLSSASNQIGGQNDPLTFTTGPTNKIHQISVLTGSTFNNGVYDWIVLAAWSQSGYCFDIFDNTNPGVSALAPGQGVWYGVQGPNMSQCSPVVPPWATSSNFRYQGNSFPAI